MNALLSLSRGIDWLNEKIGALAMWSILVACLICAGNAVIRYSFDKSSNAWLEVQWYLFAAVVMLGASVTFKLNEHVRVDLIYGKLSPRGQAWVDLFGILLFLMPAMFLLMKMSWPFFETSFVNNEQSSNAGGLVRWPFKILIPVGCGLLLLQGVSEAIKRAAFLFGKAELTSHYERPLQ